jgi:hypothetical protein
MEMNLTAMKYSRASVFNLPIEDPEAIRGFAKAPE